MFYISYIFEFLAFATGLVFLKKIRPVAYRLVIVVLFATVINEGLAYFKVYNRIGINKSYFYNSFFIGEMILFFLVFYFFYKKNSSKKNLLIASILFTICIALSVFFLFQNGIGRFNPFFLNPICICLIGFGFLYYNYIYNIKKVINLKTDAIFWFSTGLIIVNFIHLLFVNAVFIDSFRNNPNSKEIFSTLNTIGNIFYYSCFIISFICSSPSRRPAGT